MYGRNTRAEPNSLTKIIARDRHSAQPSRSARRTLTTLPGTRPPTPQSRRDYTGPRERVEATRIGLPRHHHDTVRKAFDVGALLRIRLVVVEAAVQVAVVGPVRPRPPLAALP